MWKLTGVLNAFRAKQDNGDKTMGTTGLENPHSAETQHPQVAEGITHMTTRAANEHHEDLWGRHGGLGHPQGLLVGLEHGASLAPPAPCAGEGSKRTSCTPEAASFKKPIFLMSYSRCNSCLHTTNISWQSPAPRLQADAFLNRR